MSLEAATLKTWEGGTAVFNLLPQTPCKALLCSLLLLSGKQIFSLQKGALGRGKHDGMALLSYFKEQKELGMGAVEK